MNPPSYNTLCRNNSKENWKRKSYLPVKSPDFQPGKILNQNIGVPSYARYLLGSTVLIKEETCQIKRNAEKSEDILRQKEEPREAFIADYDWLYVRQLSNTELWWLLNYLPYWLNLLHPGVYVRQLSNTEAGARG